MNLKEILENIDKTSTNSVGIIDSYTFGSNYFDYLCGEWKYAEFKRLKAFNIKAKYYFGEELGINAYFFDNEPVAVEYKHLSNGKGTLKWLSKESFKKVEIFIKQFIELESDYELITNEELTKELGSSYKLDFNNELTTYNKHNAYYNDEKISFIEFDTKHNYNIVKIKLLDGSIKEVPISDLNFKYHVSKKISKNKKFQ